MKIGDLVKFSDHTLESGPVGVVLGLDTLPNDPHPSQPHREVAYIEWACEYTTAGNYQLCILEVVNES